MIRSKMVVLGILSVGLLLIHSSQSEAASTKNEQAKVVKDEKTGLGTVTLTPKAAERLGITTTKIEERDIDNDDERDDDDDKKKSSNKKLRKVVPYSSILYDSKGNTWIYLNPEPLVYVRSPIVVDEIEDKYAALKEGPAVGTEVVSLGVAELYGAETGIGK